MDVPEPKDRSPNENPGARGACVVDGSGPEEVWVANESFEVCDCPRPKEKPPPKPPLTIQEVIDQTIVSVNTSP